MVSVQFPTNFTGPSFCGGRTKRLQTFSRHFSWEQSSKYCIAELTAIFVCLLLSGCRRYSMKWSKQLRRPVNLCPNIWFINNSKCQQFFHLKKQPPKKQVFHNFKRLFFVMGSHIDMNDDVFWEISVGFLNSVLFQLFPKYSTALRSRQVVFGCNF